MRNICRTLALTPLRNTGRPAPSGPENSSRNTTIAAWLCIIGGSVAFLWATTWMLISIDRGATPLLVGSVALMVLSAWSVFGGAALLVRKPWARQGMVATNGVNLNTVRETTLEALDGGAAHEPTGLELAGERVAHLVPGELFLEGLGV